MLIWAVRRISELFLLTEVQCVVSEIARIKSLLDSGECVYPSLCCQQILVSGEDHRASKHSGVDFFAISRAIFVGIFYGRREGGSTIVQQLIRVITGHYEVSLRRKFREILLALLVAEKIEAHVFPAVYLTIAYYGTDLVGYDSVCRMLGCTGTEEDCLIAAKIVSRLKYPQPKFRSDRKDNLILKREKHLIRLFKEHIEMGYYDYLVTRPLRSIK
jgi:penicillin-binding protein 1A